MSRSFCRFITDSRFTAFMIIKTRQRFHIKNWFITENCGMNIGKAFGPAFLERLAVSKGSAFGRPSQRAKSLSDHQSAGKVLGKPSPGVFLSAKHTIPQISVKSEKTAVNFRLQQYFCSVRFYARLLISFAPSGKSMRAMFAPTAVSFFTTSS